MNYELNDQLAEAWRKIEDGQYLVGEGRGDWIQGTLELISILDDARKRYPADQEFGDFVANAFGDRVTRDNRSALLNMAQYPDLTHEVLEKTERVSWRMIWLEEIQPRLRSAAQPTEDVAYDDDDAGQLAEAETSDATADGNEPIEATAEPADVVMSEVIDAIAGQPEADESSEEAPAEPKTQASKTTRRPKKNGANKASQDPWAKDRDKFFKGGLSIFFGGIGLENSFLQSNAEQQQNLRDNVSEVWLEKLKQTGEALLRLHERFSGAVELAEAEADELRHTGRVREYPAQVSPPVPPAA
jgi:hypothetical protein